MLKWGLRVLLALVVVAAVLFWWLMLSGASATKTSDVFDISEWRSAPETTANLRPTAVRVIEVGRAPAPTFAVQAGWFEGEVEMSMTAFEIVYAGGSILVGGAVDRETAVTMSPEYETQFKDDQYKSLLDKLEVADQIVMTHEHIDHVMAIARHSSPAAIAPNLVLNASQIAALPQFAKGKIDPALEKLTPRLDGTITQIAPGVVIVPAAGHTAGSQLVFITLQDGQEVVLIGDVAWNMKNIVDLKTRPVLTQYAVFDPNETRANVREQIRALHDLSIAEPDLAIVPSHDAAHIKTLVESGVLVTN